MDKKEIDISIKEPKNLRIKIGTKFSTLLEHCGGYIEGLEEAFVMQK